MKKVEIVFVGPYNMHNSLAALQLAKQLAKEGKEIVFNPRLTLDAVGRYVKAKHSSVGVISYFSSFETFKSRGIKVISEHNLFINGANRVYLDNGETKDYFILSSGNELIQKFPLSKDKNWATLVVAEKKEKIHDFSLIEKLLIENNISYDYQRMGVKDSFYYFEVNCHAESLGFLSLERRYRIKILGSYEIQK